MWYVLAAANAVTDADLVAGTTLKAPEVKTTANDANTFKPYDPNAILGPTTPSLPYITPPPPTRDKCGALSLVIQVVVTIVVTVFSKNPVAGAAAGDAAGQFSSAALNGRFDWAGFAKGISNPVNVLAAGLLQGSPDIQSLAMTSGSKRARSLFNPLEYGMDYDYKRTAIAAASAYAGGQAGSWASGTRSVLVAAAGAATSAAASYGTSYALSKAAGYDVQFSWRELAASAATAAAGAGISRGLSVDYVQVPGTGAVVRSQPFSWNSIAANVLTSAAGYGIRKGFGLEGHWDSRMVLADAFGNALGNAAVDGIQRWQANRASMQAYGLGGASEVSANHLPDPAMGGFSDPAYTYTVTGGPISLSGNGDVPRSTAVFISPTTKLNAASVYSDNIRTLDSIVVTGDSGRDNWFMAMWDWSQRYYIAGPPTHGGREALVQYYNAQAAQLAPDYNRYIAHAYQGQTVSVAQGIPVPDLTPAQFGNMLLKKDIGTFGTLLVGAGKTVVNELFALAQSLPELALRTNPALTFLAPMIPKSEPYLPLPLNGPIEQAGATYAHGISLATGGLSVARMAMARSVAGVAEVANSTAPRLAFQPSSGVILEATPGKTTTILGNYSRDMKYIVNELGNVKSTDFGPRTSGFNVLNVPDELYVTPKQFWGEYNQPWLSNAVTRGDPILMATEPQFGTASKLFRLNDATGKLELSGFGKEYLYLRQSGLRYDPITKQMVRSP